MYDSGLSNDHLLSFYGFTLGFNIFDKVELKLQAQRLLRSSPLPRRLLRSISVSSGTLGIFHLDPQLLDGMRIAGIQGLAGTADRYLRMPKTRRIKSLAALCDEQCERKTLHLLSRKCRQQLHIQMITIKDDLKLLAMRLPRTRRMAILYRVQRKQLLSHWAKVALSAANAPHHSTRNLIKFSVRRWFDRWDQRTICRSDNNCSGAAAARQEAAWDWSCVLRQVQDHKQAIDWLSGADGVFAKHTRLLSPEAAVGIVGVHRLSAALFVEAIRKLSASQALKSCLATIRIVTHLAPHFVLAQRLENLLLRMQEVLHEDASFLQIIIANLRKGAHYFLSCETPLSFKELLRFLPFTHAKL